MKRTKQYCAVLRCTSLFRGKYELREMKFTHFLNILNFTWNRFVKMSVKGLLLYD